MHQRAEHSGGFILGVSAESGIGPAVVPLKVYRWTVVLRVAVTLAIAIVIISSHIVVIEKEALLIVVTFTVAIITVAEFLKRLWIEIVDIFLAKSLHKTFGDSRTSE